MAGPQAQNVLKQDPNLEEMLSNPSTLPWKTLYLSVHGGLQDRDLEVALLLTLVSASTTSHRKSQKHLAILCDALQSPKLGV